jgi:hypothetical protein
MELHEMSCDYLSRGSSKRLTAVQKVVETFKAKLFTKHAKMTCHILRINASQ